MEQHRDPDVIVQLLPYAFNTQEFCPTNLMPFCPNYRSVSLIPWQSPIQQFCLTQQWLYAHIPCLVPIVSRCHCWDIQTNGWKRCNRNTKGTTTRAFPMCHSHPTPERMYTPITSQWLPFHQRNWPQDRKEILLLLDGSIQNSWTFANFNNHHRKSNIKYCIDRRYHVTVKTENLPGRILQYQHQQWRRTTNWHNAREHKYTTCNSTERRVPQLLTSSNATERNYYIQNVA